MNKIVSVRTVTRLPKYLHYLNELQEKGKTRVSSSEIAEALKTTASQVRQDFSAFGTYGAQGYGYSIERLIMEIEKIIGIDRCRSVVIIGVGGLGHALLEHLEFEKYGYCVVAAFDVAPDLIGTEVNGVPIYSVDELEHIVQKHEVEICVLTVPKEVVKQVAVQIRDAEIPAVWNFTNVDLEFGEDVVVENINLIDNLFVLTYYMSKRGGERSEVLFRDRKYKYKIGN